MSRRAHKPEADRTPAELHGPWPDGQAANAYAAHRGLAARRRNRAINLGAPKRRFDDPHGTVRDDRGSGISQNRSERLSRYKVQGVVQFLGRGPNTKAQVVPSQPQIEPRLIAAFGLDCVFIGTEQRQRCRNRNIGSRFEDRKKDWAKIIAGTQLQRSDVFADRQPQRAASLREQ